MFLNEADLLASLNHPNIVQFLGVGPLPNGSWFLVMEFIDGSTLNQLPDMRPLKSELAVSWIRQITAAIAMLHATGIVHGDLKPANVMIHHHQVRLIDFGFAWKANLTAVRATGGTIGYIAPERQTSFAADVFALGKCAEFLVQHLDDKSDSDDHRESLLQVAKQTTVHEPSHRPTAVELIDNLKEHFG